jgi:hypothetical protein
MLKNNLTLQGYLQTSPIQVTSVVAGNSILCVCKIAENDGGISCCLASGVAKHIN